MKKDIQEIKISIARIETTQKYMCKKIDEVKKGIPVCEKAVIKEKVNNNRKIIWWTFILVCSLTVGAIIKEAIATILN